MTSICAMILVMLCTALFITLDAAPVLPSATPVLPSGSESEAVGEQQFDEMAMALYNGFNPIPSSIGKRLEEGGEIQSGDKLMQTIFVTLLSEVAKKIENDVQSHNESYKELGQILLNFINNCVSAISDPNNRRQTFIKGSKQFLHEIDNLLLAKSKNANPNDEKTQAAIKGFHTLLTIFRELFEDMDEGEIQSSDDKIRQAFLDLLSSALSGSRKKSDDGEVQSVSNESDLTGSDAFFLTFLNVFNAMFSAEFRFVNPKDEAEKALFDFFDTFLSIGGKIFGNGGDEILPTDSQTLIKHMSNLFSAIRKKVENDTIQSTVLTAILNLFSNILPDASQAIEPNDEVAQSGLSTALSTVGRKINGDQGSHIQSDINVNLPKAILYLIGTVGSALQKKLNPKDEFAQILLSLINTWISETKNSIRGTQEIRVDTLPTYTAKHFDQSMLESMDEKAAMVETDIDLTDEAKIQLWGAILGSLA